MPLNFLAKSQISPLFNTAESRIQKRQVKLDNFEKFSWPQKEQSNKNLLIGGMY